MTPSNISVLTKSHNIVASKKRAKREQVKEVVFDDGARREFLTGFHKRKLQKKEEAKARAKEREKQERLETRREHRKMLADQAKKNAEETERAYGGATEEGSGSEWEGIGGASSSMGKGRAAEVEEEEYEDEEQLATVTVVEEFDPDSIIHGNQLPRKTQDGEEGEDTIGALPLKKPRSSTKLTNASATSAKTRLKTAAKAKNVKYQTNAARKAERTQQQKRKVEKAERAGGKASRKKGGPRGKR